MAKFQEGDLVRLRSEERRSRKVRVWMLGANGGVAPARIVPGGRYGIVLDGKCKHHCFQEVMIPDLGICEVDVRDMQKVRSRVGEHAQEG